MKINDHTYTFTRDSLGDGFNILRDGQWVGWSAGTIVDARNTAREMERTPA